MTIEQIVLNVCSEYIDDKLYIGSKINLSRIENAKENYRIPNSEEIFVLVDGTVFGSCKNGLALCERGIYWKNDWTTSSNKTFLNWEEFIDAEIGVYNTYDVQIGKGNLFNTSASMKKGKLVEILVNLQTHISEYFEGNNDFDDEDEEFDEDDENESENTDFEEMPPLPSELKEWFLGYESKKYGPYTMSEIKNVLLEDGFDIEKLLAWKKGMKKWENISDITELSYIIEEIPPKL